MQQIIVERRTDFSVINNTLFRDRRLSLKAKGLLALMLSLPAEWDYSIGGLCTLVKDKRDSVRSGLEELENAGYVSRESSRDEKGHFDQIYRVFEAPQNEVKEISSEKPVMHKEHKSNPEDRKESFCDTAVSWNRENFETFLGKVREEIESLSAGESFKITNNNRIPVETARDMISEINDNVRNEVDRYLKDRRYVNISIFRQSLFYAIEKYGSGSIKAQNRQRKRNYICDSQRKIDWDELERSIYEKQMRHLKEDAG